MKKEVEWKWIVNLLSSDYVKSSFGNNKSGCKRDFEKIAGASENNKEFHFWLEFLIENGYLQEAGMINTHKTYVIIKKRLIELARNHDLYKANKHFFEMDTFIVID